MWSIPGEDEYWERRREEYENPRTSRRKSLWDDEEPEYEDGYVFLDEEVDEIEAEQGCAMSELFEGDLLDILENKKGIEAETASWDESMCSINYRIRVA